MKLEYLQTKLANIRKQREVLLAKQQSLKDNLHQLDLLIGEYEYKINHYTPGTKYNGKKYKQTQRQSVLNRVFNEVCRKYGSGAVERTALMEE